MARTQLIIRVDEVVKAAAQEEAARAGMTLTQWLTGLMAGALSADDLAAENLVEGLEARVERIDARIQKLEQTFDRMLEG